MKKAVYKTLIKWYQASDKPLPGWLDRACESDAALESERAFGEELSRALRKHPNGGLEQSDSMAARVLKQITEEDYSAEQEQASNAPVWGMWIRNGGMVAAALAVAVTSFHFLNTPQKQDAQSLPIAAIEQSADELLEDLGDGWKNPLDQEIEYIVSDAKGALGFLATTFVPSRYLADNKKA